MVGGVACRGKILVGLGPVLIGVFELIYRHKFVLLFGRTLGNSL